MNIPFLIYCILTLLALLPMVGVPPFTSFFSKLTQPKIVQATGKFRKVNLVVSYFWAAVFLVGALLSWGASNELWQILMPLAVTFFVGLPGTIIGAKVLPQYIAEESKFTSCTELFELMPHGICRRYAKALHPDVIIQFDLHGTESIRGYLTLKNETCEFTYGVSPSPTVTVKCNSQLWLDISNGDADPIKELIMENYVLEGNASIMPHLQKLFRTGWHVELPFCFSAERSLYKEYAQLQPVDIKKVVIFYSGKRSQSFSKTLFMAEHLAEGITKEGGHVELIHLWDKNIRNCMGCYHCWTKTPGRCIIHDDMEELLQKYLNADLAVFASPLYVFSVNGVMKTFIDRFIPIFQPYMEILPDGRTCHPYRHEGASPTHTLVISAGGFPDVEGNFNGLRELFHQWTSHSPKATLRGELLLPAAEMIAMPPFEDRKKAVAACCEEVGKELIRNGCPSVENMGRISNPGLSTADFKRMANTFWKSMDGKKAYMETMKSATNL